MTLRAFYIIISILFSVNSFSQKDTALVRLEGLLEKEQIVANKLAIIEKLAEKANYYYPELFKEYLNKGIFLSEQR